MTTCGRFRAVFRMWKWRCCIWAGRVLVTMDAAQGIEAIRIIRPQMAIPIHYNDYPIFKSPLDDFIRAVREAGIEDRVHYLHHGDSFDLHAFLHRQPSRAAS